MSSTEVRKKGEDDELSLANGACFALDITCLGMALLIAVIAFIDPENPWIWRVTVCLGLAMILQFAFRILAMLR